MTFEEWIIEQKDRPGLIGSISKFYQEECHRIPLKNKVIISDEFSKSTIGDVKMEASVNQYCGADALLKDACVEVGLEGIASSQRSGYAAEQTALNVGLGANATAQRIGIEAGATAQRMAIAELDAINDVGHQVCDASRDGIAATERMGLFNSGVTERTSSRTQDEVERFGLSELEAIRSSERHIYAGMSANAREILLKSCADTSSIKDQSASQFKDLLLQNCENAKDAALAARDLMHQADKNTAAIQLEAFRHKEELARQIAECCCEQKALTIEKANETQQLMRDFDKERIKDERDKLREELIALRVRATLPPPLVGSVPL